MRKIDGLPVSNAPRPLRLTITKDDIERGSPLNPNSCAIARAALRQVKGATAAKVHLSCVYIMVRGEWSRWKVPEYATREIVAYDRGGLFVPGEIDFPPPHTVAALVNRIKRLRNPTTTKRRKPARIHRTENVRASAYADEPPSK